MFLYDLLFDDQSISASEEFGVLVPTEGFSKVIVMAYGDATFDVYSTPSPDGSFLLTKETLLTAVAANTGDSKEVTKLAPNLYVTIKNTSAGTAKYSLWIYGV